jgi:hypothetical protein
MRYRAGASRGRGLLRGVYTGFAQGLPMVGAKISHRDQRERQPKGYTKSRSDRPTRSGSGRQAISS